MLALLAAAFAFAGSGCAHEPASRPYDAPAVTHTSATPSNQGPSSDLDFAKTAKSAEKGPDDTGLATWYGSELAGHKTASGERFDPRGMTAAHRKLPLGTWVEVRRVDTGTSVRVRINDRGPWGDSKKVIDLSRAAAEKLGVVRDGVAKVEIRVVSGPE